MSATALAARTLAAATRPASTLDAAARGTPTRDTTALVACPIAAASSSFAAIASALPATGRAAALSLAPVPACRRTLGWFQRRGEWRG